MAIVTRLSQSFVPTLREAPADAVSASHQLLLRAGFIRQTAAGLYAYLPLGWRTVRKIERILRDEMEAAGAQEFLLPGLQPAELWRASGRWNAVDETMFRLQDRRGTDYCLAMTHEELFTALARDELRSYRQLPQVWYQIGTKFRDEPRPRGGLLRVREFLMKDAYSFDRDVAGLDFAFEVMRGAYQRIYKRCGLEAYAAEAFSGDMGGKDSIEFVALCDAGEDEVVRCAECGYTANMEVAESRTTDIADEPTALQQPETFATPGVLTIDALAAPPYSVPAEQQLKTLVYIADGRPILSILRGDHALNEAKLRRSTGASEVHAAERDEVFALMGAHPGSLGGVAFSGADVLVDSAVAERTNMVTGANHDGLHLRGVDVRRDVLQASKGRVADLRRASGGEGCPRCDGVLTRSPALEVGHIFKLGTRYSVPLGATVLDEAGLEVPLVMGSYGIGLGRLMAAVVEEHHDADGIIWPSALAPYDVVVVTVGVDSSVTAAAEQITEELARAGVEVLYDDRDVRAGVKFKDADLIGMPIRITVSQRSIDNIAVEWKRRGATHADTVPLEQITRRLAHDMAQSGAPLLPA